MSCVRSEASPRFCVLDAHSAVPCRTFAHRSGWRRASLVALAIGLGAMTGGCAGKLSSFTGSISSGPSSPAGTGALDSLARRYDSKPGEKQASLAYAQALRQAGQHGQAVAVLQQASINNVGDRDIAEAYGKALADTGRFREAGAVLAQAHSADRPNWRVLSSQGSIADQEGDHKRAREFYQQALQIAPDQPGILNNLGLSYVLTKDLAKAEEVLRKAVAQPGADHRVRANLALVLGLQGKRDEAKTVTARDQSPELASANATNLGQIASKARTTSAKVSPKAPATGRN